MNQRNNSTATSQSMIAQSCVVAEGIAPPPRLSHPLELIALFRRWPPSLPRDLLYTAIWSSGMALLLTAFDMLFDGGRQPLPHYLTPLLLISNLIGYLIHACTVAGNYLLDGWPRR